MSQKRTILHREQIPDIIFNNTGITRGELHRMYDRSLWGEIDAILDKMLESDCVIMHRCHLYMWYDSVLADLDER